MLLKQARELQERELDLTQREAALNNAMRDLRSRQYATAYQNNEYAYGYAPQAQGYYQPPQTEPNFTDLRDRAQSEGIKLQTAGGIATTNAQAHASANDTANARGCYNMGLTLFKSAFIVFCIMAFESLIVFFLRGYLNIPVVYPIVGFAVGFVQFIVCAILYACGYHPRARRKKHPSYILTAAVVFVITVIIVTMIAVYFKAQVSVPAQLLSFIVIPVAYLLNILFFTGFFYLFSRKKGND